MPTITVRNSDLARIQARFGVVHSPSMIAEGLEHIGCSVDRCDADEIEIEVFADRPDMLSAGTLAYATRCFLHGERARPDLDIADGDLELTVDPSLVDIRPVIYAAVVRGVDTGSNEEEQDDFIQALMDHQEKLHFSLGRGRAKASIGVHDLSSLAAPLRVVSVGAEHAFIPLATREEMSIGQILEQHPKGVEYAHLLAGMNRFPLILDANDAVLSFPPIINGDHTTVTETTRDFFIDVTGWDERACECSLLALCLAFTARGGSIESVRITDCNGAEFRMPNGRAVSHAVTLRLLTSMLGHEFSDEELDAAINRMGGRYIGRRTAESAAATSAQRMADVIEGDVMLDFEMPRWRFDLLHPIDLVEEIAIGHGYDDLGRNVPRSPLHGAQLPASDLHRRVSASLQGLGLQQIQSLTLSNPVDQFERVRWGESGSSTRLSNPITTEHTMLRQNLLPGLLKLLAANRHHELPQRVYESGAVVVDHQNRSHIAWLVAERAGGFAAARGMVQAFSRDMAVDRFALEPLDPGHGPWLEGRAAKIVIEGEKVGEVGEIDPAVAAEFELRVPMHGCELDLDALGALVKDPVL